MSTTSVSYRCPHCEAELQEAWAEPGGVVRCRNPRCQQRSVLDLPRAEPQVPADEARESNPVVAHYSTPMVRRYPLRFTALACLITWGGLLVVYSWPVDSWVMFGIGLGSFVIGGAWLLAWWLQARASSLDVTPHTLIFRDGVFSERVCEVHHHHITDIAIYRSWLARLLGTGSIQFTWGDDQRHEVTTVYRPHEVVELVRKYREQQPAA